MSTSDDTAVIGLASTLPLVDGWVAAREDSRLTIQILLEDPQGRDSSGAVQYRWQRSISGVADWVDIVSATAFSYLPGDADVGQFLRARFSYVDKANNSSVVFSTPTWTVENVNDLPVWALQLSGTPRQGQSLNVLGSVTDGDNQGSVNTALLTYQWYAGNTPIDGATTANFSPGQAEVGKLLKVEVSYLDNFNTLETATLTAPAVTANVNDPAEGQVWIDGDASQGQTLTANWSLSDLDGPSEIGLDRISFQWYSGSTAISGVTSRTLILSQAHVDQSISVWVRFTDALGGAELIKSEFAGPVANVDDPPVGALTLSGKAEQGAILTASGAITDIDGIPLAPADGAPVIEWFLVGGDQIPGAVGPTLLLDQSLVGARVEARYRYVDRYGDAEEVISNLIGPVADKQDAPVNQSVISGDPIQDEWLSLSVNLTDLDGIQGDIEIQWLGDGVPIEGMTSELLQLTQLEVSKTISVRLSYIDGLGKQESVTVTAAGGAVKNVEDLPSGELLIEDSPVQGQTLRVVNTLDDIDGIPLAGQPGALVYQWFLDGVALTGESGSSIVLRQRHVGGMISVRASYTDRFGKDYEFEALSPFPVQNFNDPPQSTLSIKGSLKQGETLSVSGQVSDLDLGGIVSTERLSFQWFAGDDPIGDATSASLLLTQQHVGRPIRVEVSYTDSFDLTESLSINVPGLVSDIDDPFSGGISLTGEFTEGNSIEIVSTIVDPDLATPEAPELTYAWFGDGALISGANSSSIVLGPAQVNRVIQAQVTYRDGFGVKAVASATSTPVQNVNDPPQNNFSISGSAVQGSPLTLIGNVSDVDGVPASGAGQLSYQWMSDGQDIAGATGKTFTPTQAEVGRTLGVTVSYVDLNNTAEVITVSMNDPVLNQDDAPAGRLRITGDFIEHETISAVVEFSDPDGIGEVSFTWFANGEVIPNEGDSTLRLGASQIGKSISVTASYLDGAGSASSVSASSGNTKVLNVNDPVEGEIRIEGYVEQGGTVTVVQDLFDADGLAPFALRTVQWYLNGKPIAGETSSSLTLDETHVGGELNVSVSFRDNRGGYESVMAVNPSVVANVQDAPEGELRITGVARNGMTLEVNSTLTDPDGIATPIVYQWLTEEGVISGGAGRTLVLNQSLVGQMVGISASWQDKWGAFEEIVTWLEQPVAPFSIEGKVRHWRSREEIAGAEMHIARSSDPGSSTASTLTDESGYFRFPNLDFDQYLVTGRFDGPVNGAIDTADLLATLKIANGRNPNRDPDGPGPRVAEAISPYQIAAADIDKNGEVNRADAATLMVWLRQGAVAAAQWIIIGQELGSTREEYSEISSDPTLMNYSAVLLGDLDIGL